ncbi:hypothetical protein [Kribbella sp. DT2]|uniref:hypothetical protein n=1 Tax=Kribbella sp. DT2 TaxID=3393427 RepID=UPI003CF1121B
MRTLRWAPHAAIGWATAYGLVRLWFATGHAPAWELPGNDLLIPRWPSLAFCALSAVLVVLPVSRPTIALTWAAAAGWVAVCGFALLDVVAAVLPGLGIPFDPIGMLSRLGGLAGAALLAATALARQRRLDPSCLRCSGLPTVASTPRWAVAGALVAVAGCLIRLGAQAVVGFASTPYGGRLAVILFETGFVLAGTVLPLLLVTRAGRLFPRWMLLLPGGGLGAGITAYFGVGLLQMTVAAARHEPVFGEIDLPEAFFWVAVPAYLVWGMGLLAATYGYYLRTRPPCLGCGR